MQTETKSGQTQPRTQKGELRDLLKKTENRVARLKDLSPEEAVEILSMLDQAVEGVESLEIAGGSTSSEATQLESILRQIQKKKHLFVSKVGGAAAMGQARREHSPDEGDWWWYLDEEIVRERQLKIKRWTVGIVITGVVLTVLALVYQRFFAPDPVFQAGIGFQQTAENKLIMGEYETALADVNQAIERLPNAFDLMVMRGVILDALEQPDLAEESYEVARNGFEREEFFYTARAKYYLMAALPQSAIADAEMAIFINPDSAVSYIYIAQAHEFQGDFPLAIEYFEIASEVAERTNNSTLQVMARMQLATLLQQNQLPPVETP